MHEIVTLQCGNRANYLATHFWNVQESYFTYPTLADPAPEPSPVDHDIHFRPGVGADGSDTYTPRTLIYDFQANFGGLRKLNALYETLAPDEVVRGLWDGTQQTQVLPAVEPIDYQINLDSGLPTPQLNSRDVRYWSDFNRVFYHPRSVQPISPQSFSSSLNAVESWSNGVELFRDMDREYDLVDRDIRSFVEESDSLSAFQIFSSVDDSWGGYTSRLVETLREEYGKKSIWVWAIENGTTRVERNKRYQRLTNSVQSLRTIAQHSSAYIKLATPPTSLPDYIHLEPDSNWSTTALFCAAIESATLPTRLRSSSRLVTTSSSVFEDTLNTNGNQNIWTLKARSRSADTNDHASSGIRTSGSSGNQQDVYSLLRTVDPRTPQTNQSLPQGVSGMNEEVDGDPTASHFDIDFTPALPSIPTALPSLAVQRSSRDEHIFAQVESHRFGSTRRSLSNRHQVQSHLTSGHISSEETILSSYQIALPFPILTSYPANLFSAFASSSLSSPTSTNNTTTTAIDSNRPQRSISLSAALSTTSTTKHHILTLRDLVTRGGGSGGRHSAAVAATTSTGQAAIADDEVEEIYDDLSRLAAAYDFGWEGSSGDNDDFDDGD